MNSITKIYSFKYRFFNKEIFNFFSVHTKFDITNS